MPIIFLVVETKIVPFKPALILEGKNRSLVVTDLHIGFESTLSSKNIFVGKNTILQETIKELESIIESSKVKSLILLGDIKSSIKSIAKIEWDEIPLFFKKMNNIVDTILIPGNHDANIQKLVPNEITLVSSSGLIVDNILLTHGHTLPSENFSHVERIIMGHVHPVFFQEESVLNGQRVWVSIKTDKQQIFSSTSGEVDITIIPSFNKYFYATHKKKYKKSISPIIEKIKKVTSAKIVTLDGSIIGNESMLTQVL